MKRSDLQLRPRLSACRPVADLSLQGLAAAPAPLLELYDLAGEELAEGLTWLGLAQDPLLPASLRRRYLRRAGGRGGRRGLALLRKARRLAQELGAEAFTAGDQS